MGHELGEKLLCCNASAWDTGTTERNHADQANVWLECFWIKMTTTLRRSLFDKNKALKGVGHLVTYKIYLKDRTQIREKSSWWLTCRITILSHLGICPVPVQAYILDVQAGARKEIEYWNNKLCMWYEIIQGNQI